jgi:alpha-D-ribose 1-methylphosphonate 5-triphosphate synthase subunit PhnH
VRALGIDPVHDTRATFRALCTAMSRPGTVQSVPEPADHAVLATLVDHEVSLATPDEELRQALDREGRLQTAPPASADLLHARGAPDWDVREATRGSLVEPSDGATVVYRVDGWEGTRLGIRGPGVPGRRELAVALPPPELERLAAAGADYPRGVDAVFATADAVAAVPRSSTLEVA